MCNFFRPKNMFLKVSSETAHELMVMRKSLNALEIAHLVHKKLTDILNLPRHKSRFPVEILMLCCNIVTSKTNDLMGIQMVASLRAIQIISPYFSRCRRSREMALRISALLCAAIWKILVTVLPHRTDCI